MKIKKKKKNYQVGKKQKGRWLNKLAYHGGFIMDNSNVDKLPTTYKFIKYFALSIGKMVL